MSDTDAQTVYHVACEACRLKKCKCNRILPVCGQCEKAGVQCIYPQTFKRGFPEGYLAAIENRLLQTERALFEALSSLKGIDFNEASTGSIDNAFNTRQAKAARMSEWNHLPLTTTQERQQWYLEKADKVGIRSRDSTQTQEDVFMAEITSPHSIHSFQSRSVDIPAASWPQPYVHSTSLATVRDDLPAQVSQRSSQISNAELPVTLNWQTQSSARPNSADDQGDSTPQDGVSTTRVDSLVSQNSRRFF